MGKHTLIIEADSADDLKNKIAEHHAAFGGTAAAKEAPKRAPAKKEETAAPATEPPTADATTDDLASLSGGDEAAPAEEAPPSVDDAKKAIEKYAKKHGVPKAKALLTHFKVKTAAEVEDGRRKEFVEACAK